ncbi:MAG: MvaI/BcnI restriction endonuclease family protein [Proteobacteria bacterium]|nr:MvaI/BcnI restriction endonuclease family protein [Pseudomonadota bacterium]
MMGISTLHQLLERLRSEGVRTAYVKHLAPRQDNEKNQILLAGALSGVTNLFPARIVAGAASSSLMKRRSAAGQPKLEALINFAWLDQCGRRHAAPNTRIIDYFQYPEVRLSGFLRDCDGAPDALRRTRQAEYGQRILVMGVAADGVVVGLVLTALHDPLVAKFPELPRVSTKALLRVLVVDGEIGIEPAELLRREMTAIIQGGWHSSRINRAGVIHEFRGAQGGGYTLEALLGVAANGDKKPDRHGFEIKSYSGSRISLMTPTPDLGFQGKHEFRAFMERYGRPGEGDPGTRRFVGLFRCGAPNAKTGYMLRLAGYDPATDGFAEPGDVAVELVDPASGELVAGWSLEKLANCWNAKHANALYIAFEAQDSGSGLKEYRYASRWAQGRGTDVFRLLRAIHSGIVFYDPADTIYSDGRPKVRSQWRINAKDLPAAMRVLYAESSIITV